VIGREVIGREANGSGRFAGGGRRVPRLSAGSDLGHPAAADASRANQDSLDSAASRRTHFLQIGLPSALGLIVGVAYVVADRRAFSAKGTGSHLLFRLIGV
jgi:hypothetical protein